MQQVNTISQPPGEYTYEPNGKSGDSHGEGMKGMLSTLLLLIAAPLVAVMLTVFVFQSYEVDGPSMETTLQDSDRLIVLKLGKTWANVKDEPYIPKRAEIIVFNELAENGDTGKRQLIKRVVGLPGDRVRVHDGEIRVFNDQNPKGFNPDVVGGYSDYVTRVTPGDVNLTVPAGEVFVAGDNRTNSSDSRTFGTVPARDIVGRLALRIYPFNKFETY